MTDVQFVCRVCGHNIYDIDDVSQFRFCKYCGVLFLDQDTFNLEAIGIELIHPNAKIPQKSKPGDAGFDLFAPERGIIDCGETDLIKLGIKIQLPDNVEAQVRPRSGLALKSGVQIANSPGTIDSGYRGEVGVIVYNSHPNLPFVYEIGDKVGQMLIKKTLPYEFELLEKVNDTERGEGGFGSTGGHKDL